MDKHLARLTKIKREKTQINNMRNETTYIHYSKDIPYFSLFKR